MATPIKNGVIVNYEEYGNKYLRADVYTIGDTFVFVGTLFYSDNVVKCHAGVKIGQNGMERESNGYTMLILPKQNVSQRHPWEAVLKC